jgi:hypothetical protein
MKESTENCESCRVTAAALEVIFDNDDSTEPGHICSCWSCRSYVECWAYERTTRVDSVVWYEMPRPLPQVPAVPCLGDAA